MPKILFILKRREDFNPDQHTQSGLQTGLYNSASYVNQMLQAAGVDSDQVTVIDNNDIDREVHKRRPTHVIIEALWVVPSKFSVLCKLHPNVKWIVRLHSEIPFLAQEGMALDWIGDYSKFKSVSVACNSKRTMVEISDYLSHTGAVNECGYLPNYYPQQYLQKQFNRDKEHVDVGCFGAVRPLKNTLIQAVAALQFAAKINKKLHFHINARVEQKGDTVVQNLRGMFQHLAAAGHQLHFHPWVARAEFLELCGAMDIGMQVSFSETFNIVAADFISQGVPVVASPEVPWLNSQYTANPTDCAAICQTLQKTFIAPTLNVQLNQSALTQYTTVTQQVWLSFLNK